MNRFLKTNAEINSYCKKLQEYDSVAVDTETTGLEVKSGVDTCLGASFAKDSKEGAFFFLPPPAQRKEMYKVLADEECAKILFNAKFDLHALRGAGFEIGGSPFDVPVFDVYVMAKLWNENRRKEEGGHKLKPLAAELFEKGADKESDALHEWLEQRGKTFKDLASAPQELLATYGANDARITFGLFEVLKAKLEEQNIPWALVELEGKVQRVAFEMESKGVVINKPFLTKYSATLLAQMEAIKKKMLKHLPKGQKDFNPESDEQVAKIMLHLGWAPKIVEEAEPEVAVDGEKLPPRTKVPSVDKYALDAFDHDFSRLMLQHRRLGTVRSTFVEGLLTRAHKKADGWVVHTNYNTAGAVTGRWSSSDPNLQNADKKSDVRKGIIPRKGTELWGFDLKQIEPVVFAHHSKSERLIGLFRDGLDYHRFNASMAFGIAYEKVTDEQRQSVKALGLAIMYTAGAAKAAKMMGVPEPQGRQMLARYFKEIPEAKQLQRDTSDAIERRAEAEAKRLGKLEILGRNEWKYKGKFLPLKRIPKYGEPGQFWEFVNKNGIEEYGWIRNSFGRIRRLRCGEAYKGLNALIQSDAGELLKHAMLRVRRIPLLQIHDELVYELPKADAKKIAVEIKKAMESVNEFFPEIPIRVDVARATKNWAEEVEVKL